MTRRSGRQIAAAVRDDVPLEWLLDELRLDRREFTAAITGALARTLAIDAAERHDVNVEGPLFRQAIDEFRRAHELLDAPSLAAWMTRQEIDRDAFAALMHDEAQVSWARTMYGPDIGRRLIDYLRVSGTYGALAQRARDKVSRLSQLGHENPSLVTGPVDLDGLLHWFFVERLNEPIPANLDLHAVNRGYRDRDSFVQALLREVPLLALSRARGSGDVANRGKARVHRLPDRLVVEDPAALGDDQHQRRKGLVDGVGGLGVLLA